jgi:hypothetical protein
VSTFPVGFAAHEANVRNARLLAQLAAEQGGDLAEERQRLLRTATPVDHIALRGLPCIGPGIPSVIRGTQPEGALLAQEARRR